MFETDEELQGLLFGDDKLEAIYSARQSFNEIFELLSLGQEKTHFWSPFKSPDEIRFGISGGALVRHFYKEFHKVDFNQIPEKQDIDIFPYSAKDLERIDHILSKNGFSALKKYNATSYTKSDYIIDVITRHIPKISPKISTVSCTTSNILEEFDLVHCALMLNRDGFYQLDDALSLIKEKKIEFNGFTDLPSILRRTTKYCSRGFSIADKELYTLASFMSQSIVSNVDIVKSTTSIQNAWGYGMKNEDEESYSEYGSIKYKKSDSFMPDVPLRNCYRLPAAFSRKVRKFSFDLNKITGSKTASNGKHIAPDKTYQFLEV